MKSIYSSIIFLLCALASGSQAPYLYTTLNHYQPIPAVILAFGAFHTKKLNALVVPYSAAVVYKSFDANRLRTKVDLVWETAFECNNSGFEIQRKLGDGGWQRVAFVFSQAVDGNSNQLLRYEYTDVNTGKGGSLYRLKQVDLDESTTFSEVRKIDGY